MKLLIIISTIILSNLAAPSTNERVLELWDEFKTTHQKQYTKPEELKRYKIFQENLEKIEKHNELYNEGEVTYKMEINHFSDMSNIEFRNYITKFKHNPKSTVIYTPFLNKSIPDLVDWREEGAVTPIKDQQLCGSCWSFSATGALEGANFVKTGELINLSEQELIDCSSDQIYKNDGCCGGEPSAAFTYVKDNGLTLEESYPYESKLQFCNYDVEKALYVSTYFSVLQDNEVALQEAVAIFGPISVAVDASNWQNYQEGVYYDPNCSSNDLDHAVLVVGYGTEGEDDYWLIKNSWNTDWGEEGYIKLARNRENQCGVARQATFPAIY